AAESCFDHTIDRFGVANSVFDQRDGLAPQCMLQSISYEAGHVLFDVRGLFAGRGVQLYGEINCLRACPLGLDDLDQGNEIGWIPWTRGRRWGGFHNGVPGAGSRRFSPSMILVIGITDVLLARIVSERT